MWPCNIQIVGRSHSNSVACTLMDSSDIVIYVKVNWTNYYTNVFINQAQGMHRGEKRYNATDSISALDMQRVLDSRNKIPELKIWKLQD